MKLQCRQKIINLPTKKFFYRQINLLLPPNLICIAAKSKIPSRQNKYSRRQKKFFCRLIHFFSKSTPFLKLITNLTEFCPAQVKNSYRGSKLGRVGKKPEREGDGIMGFNRKILVFG